MNTRIERAAVALFLLMLTAAGLASSLKPNVKAATAISRIDLQTMIPRQFADWRIDDSVVPVQPAPEVQAKLGQIYDQTLSRTYVNSQGQRIMLSIAYGSNQSDSVQVHRPEVCYTAQGFAVSEEAFGTVATDQGLLPVKRLLASHQGLRTEPITYWITVGNEATYVGIRQKLVQLKYGLIGQIPDGILVRVSSIDRNKSAAYALQEAFIQNMLKALSSRDRLHIAGHIPPQ